MLPELRDVLIARIAEVAPHLAAADFGVGVGFWTERVDFNRDSPLDYRDWALVNGFEGHVIGEIIADLADGIGADLLASLSKHRLRVDPPDTLTGEGHAYGLIAELKSREDGAIEGADVLVTQLRFAIEGGIYRYDPASPVPEAPGDDDV
ncbi:MAG: hypothetical protein H7Z12_15100 [Rhodospirillaceae bacterium]|nr:hypothetical protein [Rhodospirillales bacterium]